MKIKKMRATLSGERAKGENGFTLVEAIIALGILLIAVMGVFATFAYSSVLNGGNSRRSQALSVFQQEMELLRSAKFTPTIMDSALVGGTKTPKTVVAVDGFSYLVEVKVDDDPFTNGIQVDNSKTLKEISLQVTPQAANGGWIVSFPTKVFFRRVRAN